MTIEYSKEHLPVHATHDFHFDNDIAAFAVGISKFHFTHGEHAEDHKVQELSLSLSANKSQGVVSVRVNGVLRNADGNTMNVARSDVDVTVLAWTGANPGTLTLAGATDIANEGKSHPIQLPSSNPQTLTSMLAGFKLVYASGDHNVKVVHAGTGVLQNGSSALIDGQVYMQDRGGSPLASASVDGLLLCGASKGLGFVVQHVQVQAADKVDVDFAGLLPPGKTLRGAVAMLNSFTAEFKGNGSHGVQTIGADTGEWTHGGTKVTLYGPRAIIQDNNGNTQDDSRSSVTVTVIGLHD